MCCGVCDDGTDLAVRAQAAGFAFRAVAADSAYGDQDGFRAELSEAGLPFVLALKPRRGVWAYGPDAHTPVDAARALAWDGPDDPGDWRAVTRTFRDGHTEIWWAADASLGWWGPDGARRLVVATAGPGTLPGKAAWYLVTNLPRPGSPREADSPHPAASPAEITRIYGIGTGSSRATSRSKTSPAGPASRSAPIPRSAATRPWSPARSASAGPPGSPDTRHSTITRPRGPGPVAERGGRTPPYRRQRRRGRGRCAQYAPGSPPGSRCNAGGPHGPQPPRHRNCSP
jgi:DDE superfamily endonuclease